MDELITVVIPVYNAEKYLNRCIESVVNQTYRNLEIILVDSGAIDNCLTICDEYAKNDSRIKVVHKKNAGLSMARNAGLEIAKGEYIGFVDSDDYIALDMFEKLYDAAKECDADIAICAHYVERKNTLCIEIPPIDDVVLMNRDEAVKNLLEGRFIKNYIWDKLYKKTLFENVNIKEELSIRQIFDKSQKICSIPEYLYYYQAKDNNNSVSKGGIKQQLKSIIKNIEAALYGNEAGKGNKLNFTEEIYTYLKLAYKEKREMQTFSRNTFAEMDFRLLSGKTKRLVMFELPNFDNLGDHAIAYADKLFLEKFVECNSEYQLYVVDGWDVSAAIDKLKRCVQNEDIMFCQGGGNMGNLYKFVESMRHKVLEAFPNNKIIIFPQTLYFTKDAEGQVAYNKYRKIYNTPKKLTIFARDAYSYELMKEFCDANIVKMTDMVASVDASEYAADNREGIVLCLRSDMESSLDAEGKKYLYSLCRKYSAKVLVTDTVTKTEIGQDVRVEALESKWRTFGKSRLVVTDRLHGMIFCLITKTPCIVLGNNHHKVRETYNTLAKCEYIYFCNSKEEVESAINKALAAPIPAIRTDFSENYLEIEKIIKG